MEILAKWKKVALISLLAMGAMISSANAGIILTWEENSGDENDVTVEISGSYQIQQINVLDVDSYNNLIFRPDRFWDTTSTTGYNWELGGTTQLGFVGNFSSIATSTLSPSHEFGISTSGLAFTSTVGVGELFSPTGSVTFSDVSFSDLFGSLQVSDFVRQTNNSSGVDRVTSVLASQVPEPSTLAIFALGMIGLASRRIKKQS